MLSYAQLKKNHRRFLALTGRTPKEFQVLFPHFRRVYERRCPPHQTVVGQRRKRKAGGGRKCNSEALEQKLLFALVYQKTYPLQVVQGAHFEMSQSRVNVWLQRLLPLLKLALDEAGLTPERDPQQFARHEKRQRDSADLIIDGTERHRQRPKSPEKQALHYSGKKKVHSDKNVVIVNAKGKRIGNLSQT
jgi:hypothetical protein